MRKLPAPIEDAATFNGIVENIPTNNPWESAGESHAAVEKASEAYPCASRPTRTTPSSAPSRHGQTA